MTLPRWIAPGAIAFLAIWLMLMLTGHMSMFGDPGTFWHTRTGDIILAEGFIRTDPYTFTSPAYADRWWVPYQWLGEVAMSLAHRVGGFDAEFLGSVTIIAITFAFLSVRLLRTGIHAAAVATLIALALSAAGAHFHVRPHLATMMGMTFTMALLTDCDTGRFRLNSLFWLVPFFVIWVNVHGGYLGGFGTVVIAAAGWVVFWLLGRPSPVNSWRDVGLLALLVAACGGAAFVNPYGTDMLKVWRVIMGEPILREIIKEHTPFDVTAIYAKPLMCFTAVYVFVLVGVNWRDVRVSWLLPVVWMLQTIHRCRHGTLFVVAGLVAIAAIWPHTRWAAKLAKTRPDFYDPVTPAVGRPWWASAWLPAFVVLFSLALQIGKVPVPIFGAGWAEHDPEEWPLDVLDAIKANEPQPGDPHNKVFNDYVDGAVFIYHAPGYLVFVDDRCEVFGGAWLQEFVNTGSSDTSPEVRAATIARWQKTYGNFDFALTRIKSPYEDYFKSSPEWECVKRGDIAAFYRRKK